MVSSPLILPGTLEYALALQDIPPVPTWRAAMLSGNGEAYVICRSGSQGLMETVSRADWIDYCEGGELDQRMDEIEELEAQVEGILV